MQQQFDMVGLLAGDIDAAEAMTYNEYAQVLEAENPDTGELYTPEDFNVVDYEEAGVGMLQDAIWADGERLGRRRVPRHRRQVRDGVAPGLGLLPGQREACRDIVVAQGLQARQQPPAVADERDQQAASGRPTSGVGIHRRGRVGPHGEDRARDAKNLEGATVLTKAPDAEAFTNDIVTEAHAILEDLDVDINGADFAPIEVTLEEGGA